VLSTLPEIYQEKPKSKQNFERRKEAIPQLGNDTINSIKRFFIIVLRCRMNVANEIN